MPDRSSDMSSPGLDGLPGDTEFGTDPDPLPRVLLLGGTGVVGNPLGRVLIERGFPVRALGRDPERIRSALGPSVEAVKGDLRDRTSLDEALDGIEAVVAAVPNRMCRVRPAWDADREGVIELIDAAEAAGVKRFVRVSALGVEKGRGSWWVADSKFAVDEELHARDIESTIFRPTWFMEGIASAHIGPILLHLPFPPPRLNLIAGEDFGRMVAEALLDPDAANRIYDVQGPEPISIGRATRRFARAWKRYLTRVPLPAAALTAASLCRIPAACYMRDLIAFSSRYQTTYPDRTAAHDLAKPTIRIGAFSRGLRQRGQLPTKRGVLAGMIRG